MADIWYWSPRSIAEGLEFKTDIRTSRTSEIRDGYKDATQRLALSYRVAPDVAERMIALFEKDPNRVVLVPEWPTATIHQDIAIEAGDTTIPVVDSVVYAVGQDVFVGNPETSWEKCTVSAVGANEITISPGTVAAYTGTASRPVTVAPLIEAIMPAGVQFTTTFPLTDLTAQFLAIKPIDIGLNPYPVYQDRPVVTDGAYLFSALQGAKTRASVLVDSMFGAYDIVETEAKPRRFGTLSFLDVTDAERVRRRRFFHFMRGRDGEMWVPSDQPAMGLNAGFAGSSLSLNIRPFADAASMIGRSIMISQNGSTALREITSAEDVSATAQTIGMAAIGFAGTAAAQIKLLTKCRFDVDLFETVYQFSVGGLLARMSAQTVEVP